MDLDEAVDYLCLWAQCWALPRDGRVFIESSRDVEEVIEEHGLLLDRETAHALVLALSTLPEALRPAFARRFLTAKTRHRDPWTTTEPTARLAAAASIALLVVDLAGRPDMATARLLDFLHAAAQGDDLSSMPETAFAELAKIVARTRLDLDADNPFDPRAAAASAVVEVIDPSSGQVDLQEILMRATWAAARSWESERLLDFLLAADHALPGAAA
jgi:hypothetical protein